MAAIRRSKHLNPKMMMHPTLIWLVSSAVFVKCVAFTTENHGLAFQYGDNRVTACRHAPKGSSLSMLRPSLALRMSSDIPSAEKQDSIKAALKRPRGASVGVEHCSSTEGEDLSLISMQLRKGKAAAIWTSNADDVAKFSKEQNSARGDFPGPCPIIFNGPRDEVSNAIINGATAVVLDSTDGVDVSDAGIVWKVTCVEEALELLNSGRGDIFLFDGSDKMGFNEGLPKSALTIAQIESMQVDNAEIEEGKNLVAAGYSSLLFKSCCVGDDEDVRYTHFIVEGITKKRSSSFSMTGLTGSTNGHFGTSSHGSTEKWRRNSYK